MNAVTFKCQWHLIKSVLISRMENKEIYLARYYIRFDCFLCVHFVCIGIKSAFLSLGSTEIAICLWMTRKKEKVSFASCEIVTE